MISPLNRREFAAALLLAAAPARLRAQDATPPPAAAVAGRRLDLRIGNDFKAPESNIGAVLRSAADSIWQHCPNTRWETPGFFIYHTEEAPITDYRHRVDGRIAIGLTTQGNHWAQFAFQFSHEFCHALAGHSNDWKRLWIVGRKANHWLEESLCETASLFALRAMASSWKTKPPYPNWKSYSDSLGDYAADRMKATAAGLPAGFVFTNWLRENEPSMREKSILREKNNVVASQLLPLFEAEPAGWEAVTCFNLTKRDPEKPLSAQLTEWRDIAPPEQRPFVARAAGVFGVLLQANGTPL